MEPIGISLHIIRVDKDNIDCRISNDTEDNTLNFFVADGAITFAKENHLALITRNNQHQLRRIIRSAIKGNIHVGQTINCVFIEGFKFLKESHFGKFIRLDRRDGRLDITTSESGLSEVHKIYADGSFNGETNQSGYGGFTESPDGRQELYSQSFMGGSSNLMELLAITEGLQRLSSQKNIQINTDSRFVIRGLVQWVHFWRYNNWQTAYGRAVRNANYWQQACDLCEGKCVEFKWIKGHSGNVEQDFCHQLAKISTTRYSPNRKIESWKS
ncbi:ribonuclease H family protein [Desulfogranum marinum]|uniref:ribonuclease H family protein n=1 Tax=Desulfogranum marinum TaxID=453220 RepID=UPI0019626CC9|nr:ribonuclease H [Desulfogranum marinum]MBM9512153.1 ribonuclease HI [Desulfogranum marinum]